MFRFKTLDLTNYTYTVYVCTLDITYNLLVPFDAQKQILFKFVRC